MNPYFFTTIERLDALRLAAAGWVGTPFHAKAQLKGIGADCVSLALGVYADAGFHPSTPWPDYSIGEGNSLNASKVQTWLDAEPLAAKIYEREPSPDRRPRTPEPLPVEPGDLLCIRVLQVSHHVGVMIDALSFIQTFPPYCARLYTLSDPTWRRRATAIYRPLCSDS